MGLLWVWVWVWGDAIEARVVWMFWCQVKSCQRPGTAFTRTTTGFALCVQAFLPVDPVSWCGLFPQAVMARCAGFRRVLFLGAGLFFGAGLSPGRRDGGCAGRASL